MSRNIKPYKGSNLSKKDQIIKMFDGISHEYDKLNRVISLGIDIIWRKKVVQIVKKLNPEYILDIATGTGDLAINFSKTNAKKIIGIDISRGMLEIGKKKITSMNLKDSIEMIVADSENIPFNNNSFDAVTVAFGVRNFENLEKGLSEILRVLKPNGICVILETSIPKNYFFKQLYFLYTKLFLNLVGNFFSKDKKAYNYLSDSAAKFPYGKKFNNILRKIGFNEVKDFPQTFGAATIYTAKKN